MLAIIIKQLGGLDSLVIQKLPDRVRRPGFFLIEGKGFGIYHPGTHTGKGAWPKQQR
jgi:hypothetical protein